MNKMGLVFPHEGEGLLGPPDHRHSVDKMISPRPLTTALVIVGENITSKYPAPVMTAPIRVRYFPLSRTSLARRWTITLPCSVLVTPSWAPESPKPMAPVEPGLVIMSGNIRILR